MNQIKSQQEDAFIKLMQEHQKLVYKVVNLYAGDAEERKDLFQEIILQAWKAYPRFKAQSSVGTWLYRISLNTAINHKRSQKHKQVTVYPDVLDHAAVFYLPDDKKEEYLLLQKMIEDLPRLEKALVLLYLEDKSYKEIAEIMGISPSNVGTKLSRIKEQLKRKAQLLTQ